MLWCQYSSWVGTWMSDSNLNQWWHIIVKNTTKCSVRVRMGHPLDTMNICTKCYLDQWNNCWDISVWMSWLLAELDGRVGLTGSWVFTSLPDAAMTLIMCLSFSFRTKTISNLPEWPCWSKPATVLTQLWSLHKSISSLCSKIPQRQPWPQYWDTKRETERKHSSEKWSNNSRKTTRAEKTKSEWVTVTVHETCQQNRTECVRK